MRFGSVCSGIEAASVAWCQLGWKAAWLSEVDVSASAVLAHRFGASAPVFPLEGTEKSLKRIHWGDRIVNWGDMTRLPDAVRSGKATAPEILCGGTPCQGFSVAGLRGGLSDPRGQLTLSFVELANAIDDKRSALGQQPCVIFWENVPGVRSDKGNAFGHYLAGLVGAEHPIEPGPRPEPGRSSAHWTWKKETREHIPKWPSAGVVAGPRRTAAWRSSDAQYFGLAQRRERVFVVASAREGFDPQVVLFEFDSLRRDSAPSREAWEDIAGTLAARTDGGGFPGTDEACSGYVQPIGSSGLVPQWWDGSPVSQTLDAVLHKGQTMPEKNRFPAVLQPVSVLPFNTTQITSPQNGANPKWGDPCFSLASGNHPPAVCIHGTQEPIGVLNGFSNYFGKLPTLRSSFGDCGGGSEVLVAVHGTQDPIVGYNSAHALGRNSGQENVVCVTGDITHALKAEGFDASEDGTGRGQPIVPCNFQASQSGVRINDTAGTLDANYGPRRHNGVLQADMAVRRLMPVECERLQGFPDGHTAVPVGKALAADGPRYKQLGNSWAVPCVTWFGERLDRYLAELDGVTIEGSSVEIVDPFHLWMTVA